VPLARFQSRNALGFGLPSPSVKVPGGHGGRCCLRTSKSILLITMLWLMPSARAMVLVLGKHDAM